MKTIETLQKLKVLLGKNQLIITGSTALALHGLGKLTDAKDLDLVLVKPDDASKEVLSRLQNDKPNKKIKQGGSLTYSFFYEDVKVDIWAVDTHDGQLLTTVDGVQVASIESIIQAKLSYNRPKDWLQLMKLSKLFYSAEKMDAAISSINTEDDEYPED